MMVVKFKNIIVLAFTLITLKSCVEPFEPNISKYVNVFVVDGEINNLPGPYEVKLTGSYKYDEDSGINVTGAQVKIIESTGLEISLQETGEGVYRTDSSFRARIGNSYKLQITYHGEVYETDFEILKPPVPIDSIYWEYQDDGGAEGIQLLLDTHDPDNNTHYYSWEYKETWKFYVPVFPQNKPEWEKCYKYSNSYDFKIGTSIQKTEDRIERYPLLFIDNNTNRLRWRYSILVKQFTLSEQAYQFYNHLIELNESQGTLFDPVPYSLTGNVRCVTDKEKPVLGYFLVSGVSEKRIFIDNDELPTEYQPVSGFETCLFYFLTIWRENPFDLPAVSDVLHSICSSWDLGVFQTGDTILNVGIPVLYLDPYFDDTMDTLYFPIVFKTDPFGGNILVPEIPEFEDYLCFEGLWSIPVYIPIDNDTAIIGDTAINYSKSFRNYAAVDSLMNLGYFIFEVDTSVKNDTIYNLKFAKSAQCINCTLTGDNKVPDFWTEDQ